MTLKFITDSSVTAKGFQILVTSFQESNVCSGSDFLCDTNRSVRRDILAHVARKILYIHLISLCNARFRLLKCTIPGNVIPASPLLVIRSVTGVLRANSRFVKVLGVEAAGRTPYTLNKPTSL